MRKIATTNAARRGFTLIELLVVIAISSILFFLLLRPLNDAFKLTQRAQVLAAAQDSARKSLEQISREVGSAVYVFDGQSHPFGGTPVPGLPTDKYSNFLNVDITDKSGNNGTAHVYNAKLMFVPARRGDEGGLVDPTTGEPIKLDTSSGSATLDSNNLTFPGAPSNSLVLYYLGLKMPITYDNTGAAQPGRYTNSNEGFTSAAAPEDNTYVLWRAQVTPYKVITDKTTKKVTVSVNSDYFASTTDPTTGKAKAELDDPDFFRYVTTSDVNWLDPAHANYAQSDADAHNIRTANWAKIAKAVITAPDADLLLVPHNPDNTVRYDTTGFFTGVAHFGVTHDPLNDNGGNGYPIVTSSVTFRPATVSNDAAAASNSDYSSLGIPANAADNAGLPYIPTQFSTASQSWSNGYQITLYPVVGNPAKFDQVNTPYFYTQIVNSSTSNPNVMPGDVIEYRHEAGTTAADPTMDTPVYDVTQSLPLINDGRYVPLIFAQDTGLVRFNLPYLPVTGNNYQRYASLLPGDLNANSTGQTNVTPGQIDLAQLPNSPLPVYGVPPTGLKVATAIVVPGSLKVYGPDATGGPRYNPDGTPNLATAGPNYGHSVLYSPVGPTTPLGANQYRIDYRQGLIQLNIVNDGNPADTVVLPTIKNDGTTVDPVQVAFEYQANLSPTVSSPLLAKVTNYQTTALSSDNPAAPMLVKVDYQTRDLLDVGIGVRIYDTSGGPAQIVNVNNRVKVNNSNR